jgi:hypothetical protein
MSRLLQAALFGCLIGIIGLSVSVFHFAHDLEEDLGLGLLFNLRGGRKAPSGVVIVSIDKVKLAPLCGQVVKRAILRIFLPQGGAACYRSKAEAGHGGV